LATGGKVGMQISKLSDHVGVNNLTTTSQSVHGLGMFVAIIHT